MNWHLPSLLEELFEHHSFRAGNITEEGEFALISPSGRVAALPCGVGDYIEDSIVRSVLGSMMDVDELVVAVNARTATLRQSGGM